MQNVKIKFVQDGYVYMTDQEWDDWLDRLPVGEFLCLVCIGEPDEEETEMVVIETWQPQPNKD